MLKSQGPYRQSQMSPKHNDVPPVHQYIIPKNVLWVLPYHFVIPDQICRGRRPKRRPGRPRHHGSVLALAIVGRSADHGTSRGSHDETPKRHETVEGQALPSTVPG